MLTLKILWTERQDIRRVQLLAVNQALAERDQRAAGGSWDELRFADLRAYVLLVFPELNDPELDVLLYYKDDDDEQVRITNDAELAEGFRLMQEMAQAAGKDPANAVCKIIVATRPVMASSTRLDASEALSVANAEALASSSQQKKMSDLFLDLGKVVEKWEASPELATLKRDLVSILHEPGCQEALLQVMANEKFASILQTVTDEFQAGGDFLACLVAAAGTGNLEEIAKMLLQKCPHARVQVERVLQEVQRRHNVKMMSTSDYFENIQTEEVKEDLGPVVAVFEGDITCPDGTILPPNQPFDKVWKLRNGGPTKWPAGAVLSCVGGDKMQAPDHVLIPSVKPGHSIDVSLRMVSPAKAGRYTGYWRLSTPDGNRFGQRLWVDINVADPSVAAEAAIRVEAPAPLVKKHEEPAVTVPAPAPVAPKPKQVDFKWRAELDSLADMGFTDEAKNSQLLETYEGNLDAVVNALL